MDDQEDDAEGGRREEQGDQMGRIREKNTNEEKK